MAMNNVGLNYYKTGNFNFTTFLEPGAIREKMAKGKKVPVTGSVELERPKTHLEMVHGFFDSANGVDTFLKQFKLLGEFLQTLPTTEVLGERMADWFGGARGPTSALYLMVTINKVRSIAGQGIVKGTKALADLVSSVCIVWSSFSKGLADVKAPAAVGQTLTCSTFIADSAETVGLIRDAVNEPKERKMNSLKALAAAVTAVVSGSAFAALALGTVPLAGPAVLAGAAFGAALLKNGVAVSEYVGNGASYSNPEIESQ